MNLEVENFYEVDECSLSNWTWSCTKDYEYPVYRYDVGLTQQEIYEISNNNWLIHTLVEKPTPDTYSVLFEKKPVENCYWIFTGEPSLTTHTLLATPIKDTEPQPDWSFLIKKNWTYGEITTNLLLILVLGVFVWDMLRRMFKTKFK